MSGIRLGCRSSECDIPGRSGFLAGGSTPFAPTFPFAKGFTMKRTLLISALLTTLSLAACDRPTVVNVPATPVAVPGPAGPQGEPGSQGATGYQGNEGVQGETGQPGDGTTVIVVPAEAAAPAN